MGEESVFAEALERTTPEERRDYLEAACVDDPALRARVERLLAAYEGAGGLLDAPTCASPAGRGATIAGRYELVEAIGEGGMGTVWLAEQVRPVRRRVALKLIRPGMDSRTILARFEAERQALALMDHPNIARVFDGGTAEDGRPFFAMEYVEGKPLTDYCDQARLDVGERLGLFVAVCRAVQHAHIKGIVHRDLKPSNILVGLCDGRPTPKVIDFGLAKATRLPLADQAARTAPGAAMGTPLYMSPEQADPGNVDVDARADVYALGVILYELLTGTTPLERSHLREAAWHEVFRMIQEEEPPRPSVRIGASDALPSLAALRRLEPVRLARLLKGDLDWIVMKCLEKDRARRYETPLGLARDVERYLHDESVEASPPSAGYRMGKFLRRNRGAVAAIATIFLLLVGGIVGTTWGLIRAERAWTAEAARAESERIANEKAQKRLEQVKQGSEILASVFDDLDPREEEKGDRPLRAVLGERLVHAAGQLEGEGVGDPLLVAGLQDRLGRSLVHLGLAGKAIPLLEKAQITREAGLGGDHPDALESLNNLAEAMGSAGMMDRALPLLEKNLALRKASLGADHASTLESMSNLAEAYQSAGKMDLALPLYEETLRLVRAQMGPSHPNTLACMNNLAVSYQYAGRPEKAAPLLEETLARMKAELAEAHPDTLAGMNNLAAAYRQAGRLDRALPLYEEALKLMRARHGSSHPDTLTCMNNLAAAYRASGDPERSLALLREATAPLVQNGFEAQYADQIVHNLIGTMELLGRLDEAETWRRKWLAVAKARSGADSIAYAEELQGLGFHLLRRERWSDAEVVLREALAVREVKAPDAWETHRNRSLLGAALTGRKAYAEAEPVLLQAYERLQSQGDRVPPTEGRVVAEACERIVRLYESWGRPGKADEWNTKLPGAVAPASKP